MKVPSIWVTLGKRGFSSDNFGRLLDSHITGIRLNTGRSSYEWIADTIRSLVAIGIPVKNIYVDIGNNKPRLSIKNEQGFQMKRESTFEISSAPGADIYLQYPSFFETVQDNDCVYFGDGEVKGSVISRNGGGIALSPLMDGFITNGVSVGIEGKDFYHFSIDEIQIVQIKNLLREYKVNLIVSFIDNVDSLTWIRSVFEGANDIIPKIETTSALCNISSIARISKTIFIGRGDLGLSVGVEKIGIIQRDLLRVAQDCKCRVALGTGTLDSLRWSQVPLRAEVIDITNSVISGVDFIVLTSETGASRTPFDSIQFLSDTLDYLARLD